MSILTYMKTAEKNEPRPRKRSARSPRPGKREKNKERTKERILAAALKLFKEKGLEGTTTKEISKRSGIAEGTLFNYFKTKEDLALYFFQKETDDLIAWFRAEPRLRKAPLTEQLFAIIHRQLEYIEPYEDFIGAVFCRSLQPSSTLSPLSFESQELRLKYLRFIREVLAEAAEKEDVPRVGDLGAYAVGLFYLGVVAYWLQDGSRGKQKTLALLDRALNIGTQFLKKGNWEW
ncbi:MAG TPA: TetR/AcrR family transcriptional regulator [Verrucomicrobiae bacterium]|nr:TetR/AcrR family transcriptional regulator [Verrucomicrobiae bacterium]